MPDSVPDDTMAGLGPGGVKLVAHTDIPGPIPLESGHVSPLRSAQSKLHKICDQSQKIRHQSQKITKTLQVSKDFGKAEASMSDCHHAAVVIVFHPNRSTKTKVLFMLASFSLVFLQIVTLAGVMGATMYNKCASGTRSSCKDGMWCPDIVTPPEQLRDVQGGFATCSACGSFNPETTALVSQEDFMTQCTGVDAMCTNPDPLLREGCQGSLQMVHAQCQACRHADVLPSSGLLEYRTLQESMCMATKVSGLDDYCALVLCALVITIVALNELHDIRMFELTLRGFIKRSSFRKSGLWLGLFEFHGFLRKYVLLPLLIASAILFSTFLQKDAFNLTLNVVVLAFIVELDNAVFSAFETMIDFEKFLRDKDESPLSVTIGADDRRALLWGQTSFFVINLSLSILCVPLISCYSALPDLIAVVVDQDAASSAVRVVVSSYTITFSVVGVLIIASNHLIEGLNRGYKHRNGLIMKALLAPNVLLQSTVGFLIIKATFIWLVELRVGIVPRTNVGYAVMALGWVLAIVIFVLGASGMLRGGFGNPTREQEQEEEEEGGGVAAQVSCASA